MSPSGIRSRAGAPPRRDYENTGALRTLDSTPGLPAFVKSGTANDRLGAYVWNWYGGAVTPEGNNAERKARGQRIRRIRQSWTALGKTRSGGLVSVPGSFSVLVSIAADHRRHPIEEGSGIVRSTVEVIPEDARRAQS